MVGVAGPALVSEGLVDAKPFSYVISAGIIGFVPGMLLFGPAADRWDRKIVLAVAVVIFAVGSLLTGFSTDFNMLIVGHLIIGVGVGGASLCFVSLAAEYAPQRLRTMIVTTLWAGVPGGGYPWRNCRSTASAGWPVLFYFGAVAPIFALLLLMFTVPESVGYLALRGGQDDKTRSILRRISGSNTALATATFRVSQTEAVKSSVKALLREGRVRVTLALWLAFFCSFGITVMISQYTAVLLRTTGMPAAQLVVRI